MSLRNTYTTLILSALTTLTAAQATDVNKISSITGDTLKGVAASDTSWKTGGFIGLNFSQISLSHWAPGGDNSISIAANTNLFANYAKNRTQWDNNLLIAYALLKNGTEPLRKNDDRIDLTSKFGYRITPESKWFYSAVLNFKSQIANGYNYPNDSIVISRFLAPAWLTLALGVNYKPVDYFEVFLSPVSSRLVIVNDQDLADLGAYGVKAATLEASGNINKGTGEKLRSEFGAYLNMNFKKEIFENVTLASRLELFNNYTDEDENNRKNIDVNWESGLLMKVNKYLTTSFIATVVYDHNVVRRTQYRQILGVGFGYKF
jgi:hypothetical protein